MRKWKDICIFTLSSFLISLRMYSLSSSSFCGRGACDKWVWIPYLTDSSFSRLKDRLSSWNKNNCDKEYLFLRHKLKYKYNQEKISKEGQRKQTSWWASWRYLKTYFNRKHDSLQVLHSYGNTREYFEYLTTDYFTKHFTFLADLKWYPK